MPARTKSIAAILYGFTLVTVLGVVAQEKNPERNAYFGETHVHTSWSFELSSSAIQRPGRRTLTSTPWVSPYSTRQVTR